MTNINVFTRLRLSSACPWHNLIAVVTQKSSYSTFYTEIWTTYTYTLGLSGQISEYFRFCGEKFSFPSHSGNTPRITTDLNATICSCRALVIMWAILLVCCDACFCVLMFRRYFRFAVAFPVCLHFSSSWICQVQLGYCCKNFRLKLKQKCGFCLLSLSGLR